jgi:hypothetical protein
LLASTSLWTRPCELNIADHGLSDTCEAGGGDAFVTVPAGADAYVLKGVIHDWEDNEAIQILRTCRAAMKEGPRLLLIDRILPEQIDPNGALTRGRFISDIKMFLNPGGRERTDFTSRRGAAARGAYLAVSMTERLQKYYACKTICWMPRSFCPFSASIALPNARSVPK